MEQTETHFPGSIDYPQPDERIVSREYAVRLTLPAGAQAAQVSIDGGPWLDCRYDGQHWWFDWSGYEPGERVIDARYSAADGSPVHLSSRRTPVSFEAGEDRAPSLRQGSQPMKQYSVVVPNEPGMMAKVTQLLSWEEVNIEGVLTESLGDMASIRFLADQEDGLRRKLESAGFPVVESQVFHLELPNRPGELNKLARTLADEKIDIRYLYGTSHGHTTRVVLAVDQAEPALRAVARSGAALVENRR